MSDNSGRRVRRRSLLAWGAGLLGVLVRPVRAGAGASPRARGRQAGSGSSAAPEVRETWWNEEWARLVGLQGSWSVDSHADRIVMRPEGILSRIEVLARLTGRLHSYEFEGKGEVVLAHGLIMVSTALPCLISGAPGREAYAFKDLNGLGDDFNQALVEALEFHGTTEWSAEFPPEPLRRLRVLCPGPEEAPDHAIVVSTTWGDTTRLTGQAGAPLFALTIVRTDELGSEREYTLLRVAAKRFR